jgi:hypothetical protein
MLLVALGMSIQLPFTLDTTVYYCITQQRGVHEIARVLLSLLTDLGQQKGGDLGQIESEALS